MALRNLLVRIGADLSGLQKGFKQAQNQMNDFKNRIGGIKGKIAGALAGLGTGMVIKNATEDAIKFEAMMGTLSESLGNSMKDFVKWQNTVGRSLGFSKLQSAELANILSLNFKQIATSQKDLVDKTTKMMETAALIANKRGMAMSEVSDRIRSAMNQEADGADELGVNVRVSAIQQSKAYQEMANGQPWSELSSNMQKAILYHHILQSVSTNLGDTLQNNSAMKMAVFTATLNDTKLALGQAFLPILNVVLPVLTAFMNKISNALSFVAAFSRALFGTSAASGVKQQTKATQQQAVAVGGLGNATEKAGKQAKKAGKDAKGSMATFDEINKLAEKADAAGSSGSGGGGSGGGGVDVPLPMSDAGESSGAWDKISKKAQEFAAKFKEYLKPLGAAWDRLKESMSDLWNSPAIVKFRAWLAGGWGAGIEGVILIISGAFDILAGAIDIVNAILNGDWKKAWEGVGKILYGFWEIITGTIGPLFPGLTKKMKEFGDKFKEKWDALANINYADLFTKLYKWFTDLKTQTAQKWDEIKSKVFSVWEDIKTKTSEVYESVKNTIKTKSSEAWASFKAPFESAYGWFKSNVIDNLANGMSNFKTNVSSIAGQAWEALKSPFTGAYSWFKTNVVDRITSAFSSIKNAFDGSISNGFKKVYNTAVGWLNDMIGSINKIKIPGVWGGVNIPRIPALAQGGYIGANSPVLAMIGDNRHEGEIVAPESKLYEQAYNAIKDALSQNGGGGGNTEIVINLGGTTVFRKLIDGINQAQRQAGKTLIEI